MINLRENLKELKFNPPRYKKKFVEILLSEIVNQKYDIQSVAVNEDRLNFMNEFIPIYFAITNQKFKEAAEIEPLFDKYYNKSAGFKIIIELVFINTFEKLFKTELSWDYELDIEPIERFTLIRDLIPFNFPETIDSLKKERYSNYSEQDFTALKQEYTSLLLERNNPNILSVGISTSYANINLPKVYDIIFDIRDLSKFIEQKTIVKCAYNFRTLFHTDLWRGYHSHCLIEVLGDIPEIFNELPQNGFGEHDGIGLCTKYDWEFIKERNENYKL
jgi:hypothetical protein